MGTTRSRASSWRTSTSARLSSRSIVYVLAMSSIEILLPTAEFLKGRLLKGSVQRNRVAELLEEATRDLLWLPRQAPHLAEKRLLLRREVLGHQHLDPDVLIAAAPVAHVGHALAGQPERLAVLGAGRHRDLHRAVQGGHLDPIPESRLDQVDPDVLHDVLVSALELGVRVHLDYVVDIIRLLAEYACLALAGDTNILSRVVTCLYINRLM